MTAIVVTDATAGELLSLEAAKLHLRVNHPDLDTYIQDLIAASRDYCERWSARTLRSEVTRTIATDSWWKCKYKLPFPPILGVEGITYYDADNALQTLDEENYQVEISTDGDGTIIWASTADIPDHYTRADAITIEYRAGYGVDTEETQPPPVVLHAMRTKLTELFCVGTENEIRAAKEATDRLLGLVDWTGYA